MSHVLFAQKGSSHEIKMLQYDKDLIRLHMIDAAEAIVQLKAVIEGRRKTLQRSFDFLSSKRELYQTLTMQYEKTPSLNLEMRRLKLKIAIEDLSYSALQAQASIGAQFLRYEQLNAEFGRKKEQYAYDLQ